MAQFPDITNNDDVQGTAGPLFVRSIANQLNPDALDKIISTQRDSLSRFEKTNEMLVNCNTLSLTRLAAAVKELQPYRQTLVEMKRDLDAIFRRIRILKQNFSQLYPEAFAAAQQSVTYSTKNEDNEIVDSKEHSKNDTNLSAMPDSNQK